MTIMYITESDTGFDTSIKFIPDGLVRVVRSHTFSRSYVNKLNAELDASSSLSGASHLLGVDQQQSISQAITPIPTLEQYTPLRKPVGLLPSYSHGGLE